MELKKRYRGTILGLAIGDALGMPAEGLSAEEIKSKFGYIDEFIPSPNGFKAGEWTDDTEEMLILAESILETIYFNPENFARKLVNAMNSGRLIKAGPTTRRAIYNLQRGFPWNRSGINADTCGAAMRIAPLGLVYSFSLDLVEKYSYISSIVTHRGNSAISGAIAISISIACICNEFERSRLLDEVVKRSGKFDSLLADKILAKKVEGVSMLSWDAVPSAFHHFLTSENFRECVAGAVNSGGDTDSIAAMAGAMKGAEVGINKIPEKWVKNVKDSDYLIEIADRLYELSSAFF
ncbi:MAG TPA: ADP-ribosylglycohydrolase family protein [Archaeoglobaceae archaeon]|nr:ADP-ribosylglycohydrolase family protein [Archaeoglobaceae archaeon]